MAVLSGVSPIGHRQLTKRRKRPLYVRVEQEDAQEYQRTNAQEENLMSPQDCAHDSLTVERVIYDIGAAEPYETTD